MEIVNLADKLRQFEDTWNPRLVAELNGQDVKLVKLEGEFVWHHHDNEDELFLVIDGRLRMDFRDHSEHLVAGEFIVVPRGVEHRPAAESRTCSVLLFEPSGTLNTGNVREGRTRDSIQRL